VKLYEKLDEFAERQQIASAEFCLIVDSVERLEDVVYELEQNLIAAKDQNHYYQLMRESLDKATVLKEANAQLADKIKMLDLQRENAEFKLKEVLGAYRKMKKALGVYADSEHEYWIDYTDKNGVHKMKNIKQLEKLAREVLEEL